MSEFNIPLDPIIIKRSYIELQYAESGYSNTLDILQLANPPTALFVASDLHAMGVYRACYELNIKIPDDLSIVGYDNISYGEYLNPPLTTIHQSKYEMSEIACKLLLDRIRGEKSEPKEIFLDTRLIERASCSKYKNMQMWRYCKIIEMVREYGKY